MATGDVECLVGEGELVDTALLELNVLDAGHLSDSACPWEDGGIEVNARNVTEGMSLAKLTEMVPEPAPTSKSFKLGLDSFIECNLGSK